MLGWRACPHVQLGYPKLEQGQLLSLSTRSNFVRRATPKLLARWMNHQSGCHTTLWDSHVIRAAYKRSPPLPHAPHPTMPSPPLLTHYLLIEI